VCGTPVWAAAEQAIGQVIDPLTGIVTSSYCGHAGELPSNQYYERILRTNITDPRELRMKGTMRAPEANRMIARAALDAFGGEPNVRTYWDANERSSVDVQRTRGDGVASYATVNLSNTPLRRNGEEFPTRVEFLGALAGSADFALVLSTAAFCVINSGWFCSPGAVFPGVVKCHNISTTMHHAYFTTPTLWGDKPATLRLEDRVVAWLLLVPIAQSEYEYIGARGSDKFENLLESSGADILDINRPPVC
jgi:antitoxin YqcF